MRNPGIVLLPVLLYAAMAGAGDRPSPLVYAQLYERELAGDAAGALAGYQALLQTVTASEPALAEKTLYRIGVCEQRLGRPEATRRTWRRLVETYPVRDPEVIRTREELKVLERELDRVTITGRVETAKGQGHSAFVFAGEWGDEPALMTDATGAFRVGRKVAGQAGSGESFCLIYAEHPLLPLVAAEAVREDRKPQTEDQGQKKERVSGVPPSGSRLFGGTVRLLPALTLFGSVEDSLGRPVAGAAIQVMGYHSGIPFPFDRLLPPVVSATNGTFSVPGLVPGLRYVLTAFKPGYRLVSAVERDTPLPDQDEGESSASCGAIVVRKMGEISLRGKVVNESGVAAQADVAAWSLPPIEREVARVSTDPVGRFVFRDLHENAVTLKVEGEGFLPKAITGLKPMGQEIDVVLRGNGLSVRSREPGSRSQGVGEQLAVFALDEAGEHEDLSSVRMTYPFLRFPVPPFPLPSRDFRWLRGNPENGAPLRAGDLIGHVVVYHLGSAYLEAAMKTRYPGEPATLSRVVRCYGESGVICIWVLPESEARDEAARMILESYPDLPVASLMPGGGREEASSPASIWGLDNGNIVVGRDGRVRALCSDPQLFKAVKAALTAKP